MKINIKYMMLAIVFFAAFFSSILYPSSLWINALCYLKITALLCSLFLAKYANRPQSNWWFGFAAFAICHLLLNVHTINDNIFFNYLSRPGTYINVFDINGTIGLWLTRMIFKNNGASGIEITWVIREWATLMAGVIGGLSAVYLDKHLRTSR